MQFPMPSAPPRSIGRLPCLHGLFQAVAAGGGPEERSSHVNFTVQPAYTPERVVSLRTLLANNLPALAENKGLDDFCKTLHLAGQWGLYALVALHVLATARHVAIRRDGLLSRMIPRQDGSPRLPPS